VKNVEREENHVLVIKLLQWKFKISILNAAILNNFNYFIAIQGCDQF